MPADAAVDESGASGLDGLGQQHNFVPTAAIRDQVDDGQPVNQDEVGANGLARAADNFDRQAYAVGVVAAPFVAALIGVGDEELVDEITFAAHDLDTVIASIACQQCAADKSADLPLYAGSAELARGEGRNRALDARRRHAQRVVAIAAGVQDLQRNLAALQVDGICHLLVAPCCARAGQHAGERFGPAGDVGRKAACHHQADAAARPLGKVGRHRREVLAPIL